MTAVVNITMKVTATISTIIGEDSYFVYEFSFLCQ